MCADGFGGDDNYLLKILKERDKGFSYNLSVFDDYNIPPKILHRKKEIETLLGYVLGIIRGELNKVDLNIYGLTGTGKTVTTKKIMRDTKEFMKRKDYKQQGFRKIDFLYFHVYSEMLPASFFSEMNKWLFKKTYSPKKGLSSLVSLFMGNLDKYMKSNGLDALILVIDDIHRVKNMDYSAFAGILRNTYNNNVSLWLISNSAIKPHLPLELQANLLGMKFRRYDVGELLEIFAMYVQNAGAEQCFSDLTAFMRDLASWVEVHAKSSVRAGLIVLKHALLSMINDGRNTITQEDMEKGKEMVKIVDITEMLETMRSELVLTLVLALRRMAIEGKEGINTIQLYKDFRNYVSYYIPFSRSKDLSMREFRNFIADLEELGLIMREQVGKGRGKGSESLLYVQEGLSIVQAFVDLIEGNKNTSWVFEDPKLLVSISKSNAPLVLYDSFTQKIRGMVDMFEKDGKVYVSYSKPYEFGG